MSESYPIPELIATADAITPGQRLPLRLQVCNPTDEPLEGATAELTLEVERGVLITWQLSLCAVPANQTVVEAIRDSQPELLLPLNVPAGEGKLRLILKSRDGAWLNQVEMGMGVEG